LHQIPDLLNSEFEVFLFMNLRKVDEIVHADIEQLIFFSQALQDILEIFYEHRPGLEV
jgi:hypothetical protein